MHRLTARLLLFFALAGNCAPLAMAFESETVHACCVRKAHHCHEAAAESATAEIRSASCCGHDCCGAAVTGQWAHPRSPIAASAANDSELHNGRHQAVSPNESPSRFRPARAPPKAVLA